VRQRARFRRRRGKPPVHNRYKRGPFGNPSGPRSRNLPALLSDEVVVTIDGERWEIKARGGRDPAGQQIDRCCGSISSASRSAGRIRWLIINLPPRHLKSLLDSIAFSACLLSRAQPALRQGEPAQRFQALHDLGHCRIEGGVISARALKQIRRAAVLAECQDHRSWHHDELIAVLPCA
jgi:hypothetical protein